MDGIGEVEMLNPTLQWEFADSMSKIPFIAENQESSVMKCYCSSEIEGESWILCSSCGCWSHMSCYSLFDKSNPDQFICLSCQHKASMQMFDALVPMVIQIEEKLKHMDSMFEAVTDGITSNPDSFGFVSNPEMCNKLSKRLNTAIHSISDMWQNITPDLREIETIASTDVFENTLNE